MLGTSRPPGRSGRPGGGRCGLRAGQRPARRSRRRIATIDRFAYEKSFLINVGDEKGRLLDAAVRRADPELALELGTYCGYSALRIARAAPGATVYSVELSPRPMPPIARRIWAHAGVGDRVHLRRRHHRRRRAHVGRAGDTIRFGAGELDFVFLDHDKNAYLADLQSIVDRGWLHPGSIVVADNVRVPGRAQYRAYMREQQGGAGTPSSTRRTPSTRR